VKVGNYLPATKVLPYSVAEVRLSGLVFPEAGRLPPHGVLPTETAQIATGRQLRKLAVIAQFRGAEAACSVCGSPSDWRNESALADFHELRQDFSPTKHCGWAVTAGGWFALWL